VRKQWTVGAAAALNGVRPGRSSVPTVVACVIALSVSCGGPVVSAAAAAGVIRTIPVGLNSRGVSSDGTHVWVANAYEDTVSEIDASNGTVIRTIPVGVFPYGVSSDGAHVWVANTEEDTVSEIDASNGTVIRTIPVGYLPYGVSSDGTQVWVTNWGENTVSEIDAASGTVIRTIAVGETAYGVSSDGTDVWVANTHEDLVTEIEASSGEVIRTIPVGSGPYTVSSDGTHVWVANTGENTVSEIEASSGTVIRTIPVGSFPAAVSSDGTDVWVADYHEAAVSEIEASSGTVIQTIPVGEGPYDVSSDGTHVWVANLWNDTVSELSIAASSGGSGQGYKEEVLADEPIGYWRLGDALDSSVMSDATGKYPGTYVNGAGGSPQLGIAGDGSTAAYFVGNDQYGYVNNIPAPQTAYSMEAWVLPQTQAGGMIMQQGGSGALYINSSGQYVFVPSSNEANAQVVDTNPADLVPPGGATGFHQVVGTWNGTTATLYVDGREVASTPSTQAPSGAATLYIGYGTLAPWFHGYIDETAYYAHALSPERVLAHYQADPPPPLWVPGEPTATSSIEPAPSATQPGASTAPTGPSTMGSVLTSLAPGVAGASAGVPKTPKAVSQRRSHRRVVRRTRHRATRARKTRRASSRRHR
jgi:YVTN family beta-propeller protein